MTKDIDKNARLNVTGLSGLKYGVKDILQTAREMQPDPNARQDARDNFEVFYHTDTYAGYAACVTHELLRRNNYETMHCLGDTLGSNEIYDTVRRRFKNADKDTVSYVESQTRARIDDGAGWRKWKRGFERQWFAKHRTEFEDVEIRENPAREIRRQQHNDRVARELQAKARRKQQARERLLKYIDGTPTRQMMYALLTAWLQQQDKCPTQETLDKDMQLLITCMGKMGHVVSRDRHLLEDGFRTFFRHLQRIRGHSHTWNTVTHHFADMTFKA